MYPRLDMIGLTVSDMARSFAFYRLLGIDVPDVDPSKEPYAEATLTGGIRLSWNHIDMVKQIEGDHYVSPVGQRVGLAFLCENPGAVDQAYAKVVAEGFEGHKEPWDAFWGQRYAQVKDPDGNVVDLFAPL